MMLLESWKDSWANWSQKVTAVITLLPLAWASLPPRWQDSFPDHWVFIFSALGIGNFIVRNLWQKKKTNDPTPKNVI